MFHLKVDQINTLYEQMRHVRCNSNRFDWMHDEITKIENADIIKGGVVQISFSG